MASRCERCGNSFNPRRPWQKFCGKACRRDDFKARHPLPESQVVEHLSAMDGGDFRELLRRTLWARELEAARRERRPPRAGRLRVRWRVESRADLFDTDRGPLWQPADDAIATAESAMQREGSDDGAEN